MHGEGDVWSREKRSIVLTPALFPMAEGGWNHLHFVTVQVTVIF